MIMTFPDSSHLWFTEFLVKNCLLIIYIRKSFSYYYLLFLSPYFLLLVFAGLNYKAWAAWPNEVRHTSSLVLFFFLFVLFFLFLLGLIVEINLKFWDTYHLHPKVQTMKICKLHQIETNLTNNITSFIWRLTFSIQSVMCKIWQKCAPTTKFSQMSFPYCLPSP